MAHLDFEAPLVELEERIAALKALTDAGWEVKDRVALLTGDPLQDESASGAGLGITSTAIGIATGT